MQKQGIFLSIEGIDGAGKSSHLEFIQGCMNEHGLEVIVTREPGGTKLGEKIRDLLLTEPMHSMTELLLFFASRQQIIQEVIMPNLSTGKCVVADRFVDASIAYQGSGRLLGTEKVLQIYKLLEPQIQTDLTLLFDAPISVAMKRVARNRTAKDRLEKEPIDFFNRVQNTYYELARHEPDRIKIVSTDCTILESRKAIKENLITLLKNKGVIS